MTPSLRITAYVLSYNEARQMRAMMPTVLQVNEDMFSKYAKPWELKRRVKRCH